MVTKEYVIAITLSHLLLLYSSYSLKILWYLPLNEKYNRLIPKQIMNMIVYVPLTAFGKRP